MITEESLHQIWQNYYRGTTPGNPFAFGDGLKEALKQAISFGNWISSLECGYMASYAKPGIWYKQKEGEDTKVISTEQLFELYTKSNK